MEEDLRTPAEKIIAGDADIGDYDVNRDFDDDEAGKLLDAGLARPEDFSEPRAAELIIEGVLNFDARPFEEFSPYQQLRLLAGNAITAEEFRKRADLAGYDAGDWLALVAECPKFAADAPWEKLRAEATPRDWFAALARRPEFADRADWAYLSREGFARDVFKLLKAQPDLYDRLLCKDELMEADSRYWVELIIRQPRFAEVYPVETLDEVDEVELLLLYRPELARRIPWEADNPPVKLVVVNAAAPYRGRYDEVRQLLRSALYFPGWAAGERTDCVTEERETFAGIFDTRSAKRMAAEFRREAKAAQLPLTIRLEELNNGK